MFRKILDGEMRDAAKKGVEVKCRKDVRGEITLEEEELFWTKGLLGCHSAECLLNTIYFYNGKLFGLRSNEHRLMRVSNIVVKDCVIIFDESVSKTFHGGLKDLKKNRRLIEQKCHKIGEEHSRCLVQFYNLYLEKIAVCIEANPHAFYFKPHRSRSFAYEKSAVGVNTLAKILPEKLCANAGIERKTSHCLRVTCATRLFQRNVQEKQIRERTGHRSDSLFRYEKPSDEQVNFVSNALAPPMKETGSSVSDGSIFGEFGDFECSDETLAMLDMTEFSVNCGKNAVQSTETESSPATSRYTIAPVFNNCVFNSCERFWTTK